MSDNIEKIELVGCHGTDVANNDGIFEKNFEPSFGDDHWLGEGVYFFIDGISAPNENARKWAIVHAWDNDKRNLTYQEYVVIKADISVEEKKFIDLTTTDGIKIFNHLRDQYVEKIKNGGKSMITSAFKDGHVLNKAREEMNIPIDVVKGNFYIKFTAERMFQIQHKSLFYRK